jgi:hypothetical protein
MQFRVRISHVRTSTSNQRRVQTSSACKTHATSNWTRSCTTSEERMIGSNMSKECSRPICKCNPHLYHHHPPGSHGSHGFDGDELGHARTSTRIDIYLRSGSRMCHHEKLTPSFKKTDPYSKQTHSFLQTTPPLALLVPPFSPSSPPPPPLLPAASSEKKGGCKRINILCTRSISRRTNTRTTKCVRRSATNRQ